MPINDNMSAKKKELLAYKAKILQEMRYYDHRIEEVRSKCMKTSFIDDSNSSDSEEEFSLSFDAGPSASQLNLQQTMLKTRLQATQELTSLHVLQSEVNVLVEDPEVIGEPPVKEPGVWREVTAECKVDLVPFSMTFFVHQPHRQFGQLSYRGLRVVPVKSAHEGELQTSVLPLLSRPSDAVEVLRSFAHAQRSRRSTLARLADKFPNQLYMEPMPDGGYTLKCANLLEVSWQLQNKWSPVAPFHHRLKFEIEYMDESYIKIITQAHRQLADPSLETDERTLLLAKIISTCLEAQGPTQELYDSISSDPENARTLKSRRTTLDQEPEAPGMKKKKEKELMAPPKSLPKKSKLKGKENMADNRKEKIKRGNSDENIGSVKKIRTETGEARVVSENGPKTNEKDKSNAVDNSNSKVESIAKQVGKTNVASSKHIEAKKGQNKKENDKDKNTANDITGTAGKNKTAKENTEINKATENTPTESNKKVVREKSDNIEVKKSTPLQEGNVKNTKAKTNKVESAKDDNNTKSAKNKDIAKGDNQKAVDDSKKVAKASINVNKNGENPTEKINNAKTAESNKKIVKEKSNAGESDVNGKNKKQLSNEKDNNVATSKNKTSTKATVSNATNANVASEPDKNKETSNTVKVDNAKNVATSKTKSDAAKTNTINAKGKSNVETVKDVAYVKNKPSTKDDKESNKQTKFDSQKSAANSKSTDPTKTKAPAKPTVVNNTKKVVATKTKSNTQINKEINNKPQQIAKSKTQQNKTKAVEITKNANNAENTIEKVVEKRQSVPVKRKSNMVDRINDVASTKKLKLLEKPASTTQKYITENKMQKNTKNVTPKNDFKSKLIPGGIKTQMGSKVLSNIEKQNSDKKSKIPQKKLSAISESNLKKNPLRISPRKIPSKFKTTSAVNNQKLIQKTTSIPRLLKKPVPII